MSSATILHVRIVRVTYPCSGVRVNRVAVAHVPAHELGAAAYAIRAARAAAPEGERKRAGRLGCRWQRARLPGEIRELVLDDQGLRNGVCWHVFDC